MKNEIKLTENEKEVLIAITKDDFFAISECKNINEICDVVLWSDNLLDTLKLETKKSPKILRGVLSSLSQKNLIEISQGEDSVTNFKPLGYEITKELLEKEKAV